MNLAKAQAVIGDLGTLALDTEEAVRAYHLATADAAFYQATELNGAQQAVRSAEATAQFAAYGEGEITGKNQAERDMRLTHHLANDDAVIAARASVAECERELAALEATAERAKGDYKAAAYHFNAARAQAQLLAAMMNMAAQGEDLGAIDEPEYEFGQAAF